jgi:excisionase family DNA binding protein
MSTIGPQQPLLVTADEAARILGIGRTSVYRLMQTGDLRPVKLGDLRATRFRRRDVLALIGEEC